MTAPQEWSRSRYWHIHFLHSRHQRAHIDWGKLEENPPSAPGAPGIFSSPHPTPHSAIQAWLAHLANEQVAASPWLTRQVTRQFPNDPAYIQSLRLCLREQQHHRELISRWLEGCDLAENTFGALGSFTDSGGCENSGGADSGGSGGGGGGVFWLTAGRVFGPRFTLACMVLNDLVDQVMLTRLAERTDHPTLGGILAILLREKQAHTTFHVERLTWAFADFNFLRRNLRRHRLRALFALRLTDTLIRHRRAVAALDFTPLAFSRRCWRRLETQLNLMVPYQRDTLLRTLVAQKEQPYAQSDRIER